MLIPWQNERQLFPSRLLASVEAALFATAETYVQIFTTVYTSEGHISLQYTDGHAPLETTHRRKQNMLFPVICRQFSRPLQRITSEQTPRGNRHRKISEGAP